MSYLPEQKFSNPLFSVNFDGSLHHECGGSQRIHRRVVNSRSRRVQNRRKAGRVKTRRKKEKSKDLFDNIECL